jgi:hypothetical protein
VRTGPGKWGSKRRTGPPDGTERWSSKPGQTSAENANGHFKRHVEKNGEFPALKTEKEYIDAANDFVWRLNVFDRRLSAPILSFDRDAREPQHAERAHLVRGRKGVLDDQLRCVGETQDRETAVAVEEPDVQHAACHAAARARNATVVHLVWRALS